MTAIEERLIARIVAAGPLTVAEYMATALTDPDHGYYRGCDPLGAAGDFITAPEVSQMFGEMIGAWLIDCWEQCGRPNPVRLVELGPGRGTLMADALRIGRLVPGWLAAVDLNLVEINPSLRETQAKRLAPYHPTWRRSLSEVPDGPMLLVANEFLDALPIRQLVYLDRGWRERMVGWTEDNGFHFLASAAPSPFGLLVPAALSAAEGDIFEWSPSVIETVAEIAGRIVRQGGAALLIDYGRDAPGLGQTLQAVRNHQTTSVLTGPGRCDVSAHVDFSQLRRVAAEAGAATYGPCTQGEFLKTLGIVARTERLKRERPKVRADELDSALARLTAPALMGTLFKAAAIAAGGVIPCGFDGGVRS